MGTHTRVSAGWRVLALTAALSTLALGGVVHAQAPSPPADAIDLCVVTLAELNELTGLAFEHTASGSANCAYTGGPADAPYLLDVSLEDPGGGFVTLESPEDRMAAYPFTLSDGERLSIADHLAWSSSHGLAVDMGGQVLVMLPVFVFAADPPDPGTFLVPVAELAVPRLPAVIPAAPPPTEAP